EDVFKHADFITLHVPAQEGYVIGKEEFQLLKDGVGIVNCARGGVIDEVALVEALDAEKVAFAGLDVFENEPTPEIQILMHPKISLTPHIGAATLEAQDRIGTELAEQIISLLKTEK
ncbi:MAG TPA: NAD(P)-dependent oxidoreductase, partial [Flavobacterium sp.]|nr:NAD(P)-dependent oxidoreductase [Flavobacterium sp.]